MPRVIQDGALDCMTTFGIGGPADRLIEAEPTVEDLEEALDLAEGTTFVMGGGSNLLVADDGFRGTVLRVAPGGTPRRDGDTILTVPANCSWGDLVDFTVRNDLQGVELLAGIPGTVGGAIVQNAGAYMGQCVKHVLESVVVFDVEAGITKTLMAAQCELEYRTSVFKSPGNSYLILEATFQFASRATVLIDDERLLRLLGLSNPTVSLAEASERIFEHRRTKDHLALPESMSAGSFFKNIPGRSEYVQNVFEHRKRLMLEKGCDWVQSYDATNREGQLIAGSLIATSGDLTASPELFKPGSVFQHLRLGRGGSNTVVNEGNATAKEVIDFASRIRDSVFQVYDVVLEPEVILVGDIALSD